MPLTVNRRAIYSSPHSAVAGAIDQSPELDGAVLHGRGQPQVIRREYRAMDPSAVSGNHPDQPASGRIPLTDRTVVARRCDYSSIVRKFDRPDGIGMADRGKGRLAAGA